MVIMYDVPQYLASQGYVFDDIFKSFLRDQTLDHVVRSCLESEHELIKFLHNGLFQIASTKLMDYPDRPWVSIVLNTRSIQGMQNAMEDQIHDRSPYVRKAVKEYVPYIHSEMGDATTLYFDERSMFIETVTTISDESVGVSLRFM